ncbi:hypothetical protein B0H14DRAFT_3524152 [Mycena olivaceomarginata]|nr:hypothetical protein B0H14DRAFT_3524152 [Mycena olivaceomarginata]
MRAFVLDSLEQRLSLQLLVYNCRWSRVAPRTNGALTAYARLAATEARPCAWNWIALDRLARGLGLFSLPVFTYRGKLASRHSTKGRRFCTCKISALSFLPPPPRAWCVFTDTAPLPATAVTLELRACDTAVPSALAAPARTLRHLWSRAAVARTGAIRDLVAAARSPSIAYNTGAPSLLTAVDLPASHLAGCFRLPARALGATALGSNSRPGPATVSPCPSTPPIKKLGTCDRLPFADAQRPAPPILTALALPGSHTACDVATTSISWTAHHAATSGGM